MAGTFTVGEKQVRPGVYFQAAPENRSSVAQAADGITAVILKADFGPLGKVVELNQEDSYEKVFGNSDSTEILGQAFAGGAKTLLVCRVGKGGTASEVKLKSGEEDLLTIQAKYPGSQEFSVTIRTKLTDEKKKECKIYAGTKELESYEFEVQEETEASALAAAMKNSERFQAQILKDGKLDVCSQKLFTAGTNPETAAEDYGDGLAALEPFYFNTICTDTEDVNIHMLIQAFMERIFQMGQFAMAVVAENHSTALQDRQAHAEAFNDKAMIYVLNPWVKEGEKELDGAMTAARIAGMVAACKSSQSLTHTVLEGVGELLEPLTPSQMTEAEKKGCLVLSYSMDKQVWIDNAINTLVDTKDEDQGWKKIRRTKTRYELIYRMNQQAEKLVGRVDNDTNGRATVTGQLQAVGTAMVDEGKLTKCTVTESETQAADTDSAWFDVEVVDKDSLEHIYLTYHFQYSTKED